MINKPSTEIHISSSYMPILANIVGSKNRIILSLCPNCLLYNTPHYALQGICYYCGFDINKEVNKTLRRTYERGVLYESLDRWANSKNY